MYGLPQAGILAKRLLTTRLDKHGNCPVQHTPGLWRHKWWLVTFALVVDDFGVKYVGKQNAQHLIDTLKQWYKVSEDWSGSRYCGMTINWQYNKGYVDISMPRYIKQMLHKFQHKKLKSEHSRRSQKYIEREQRQNKERNI